ncbi:MAG: hypothetical protein U0441_38295 [Polyangiaceae bacterium]
MPDAAPEYPFRELPAILVGMAQIVAHAARGWLGASFRAARGSLPESVGLLALSGARVGLQMAIERSGEEILFFFFKHDLPVSRPARLSVSLTFAPEPVVAPGAEREPAAQGTVSTDYQLALPWFAMRAAALPSPAPLFPPGATQEEVLLLGLGSSQEDVLAVVPEPRERRRIRVVKRGNVSDFQPAGDLWDAGPFLAFVDALRAYSSVPSTCTSPYSLPGSKVRRNDLHVTLDILAAATAGAAATVAAERDPEEDDPSPEHDHTEQPCPCDHPADRCPYLLPLPPDLAKALPATVVDQLHADLSLRLAASGQLAPSGVRGIPLDLHLDVRPSGARADARMAVDPPPILRTGPLREAILTKAAKNADLAEAFSPGKHQEWDRYFEGARSAAVVFRSSRDEEKEQIEVIALAHVGRVVLAWMRVEIKEEPELSVEVKDVAIFHHSRPSDARKLDNDGAARFFTLFRQLRDWLSFL